MKLSTLQKILLGTGLAGGAVGGVLGYKTAKLHNRKFAGPGYDPQSPLGQAALMAAVGAIPGVNAIGLPLAAINYLQAERYPYGKNARERAHFEAIKRRSKRWQRSRTPHTASDLMEAILTPRDPEYMKFRKEGAKHGLKGEELYHYMQRKAISAGYGGVEDHLTPKPVEVHHTHRNPVQDSIALNRYYAEREDRYRR